MDLDKMIHKLSRIVSNTKPDKCEGCPYIYPDPLLPTCRIYDGDGYESAVAYELANGEVKEFCPLIDKDSEEYKEISELLAIYIELKEARGKLKAIEDIAREILNRPNTENTRVNLKRALTDILDISKSGEEADNEKKRIL